MMAGSDDEQLGEQAVVGLDAEDIDELVEEMLTDHVAGNRCWGFELSGVQCTPGFVAPPGHFQGKFCARCRSSGFTVAASRVCILLPTMERTYVNANGRSLWTNGARVVNQTSKCTGSRVVIFKEAAPAANADAVALPSEWLHLDAQGVACIRFEVKLGTVVPCSMSAGIAVKRLRSAGGDAGSAPAYAASLSSSTMAPTGQTGHSNDADGAAIASAHEVARVCAALTDERFQQTMQMQLRVCIAALGALDPSGLEAMHRMYFSAAMHELGGLVGAQTLQRVVSTIQRGTAAPLKEACDEQASAQQMAALLAFCSGLHDVPAWTRSLAVHAGTTPPHPGAATACAALEMHSTSLSGLLAPLQKPASGGASTRSSPGCSGALGAACRDCVHRTVQALLERLGDAQSWHAVPMPDIGGSARLGLAGGKIFVCSELVVEATAGAAGATARTMLWRFLEVQGLRRTEDLGGGDVLCEYGLTPAPSLLERMLLRLLGPYPVLLQERAMEHGHRIIHTDWDAVGRCVSKQRAAQSPLTNLATFTLTHDGATQRWRLCYASLVTALPEYGLGRILANNLSPTPLYPIFYAAIRTKMRRSTEALKGMLSPAGS